MDRLLTVKQVAYILNVHPLTIRRYIREKKLPAIRAAGTIRIKEADLAKLQHKVSASPKTAAAERRLPAQFSYEDPLWLLQKRSASIQLPGSEV